MLLNSRNHSIVSASSVFLSFSVSPAYRFNTGSVEHIKSNESWSFFCFFFFVGCVWYNFIVCISSPTAIYNTQLHIVEIENRIRKRQTKKKNRSVTKGCLKRNSERTHSHTHTRIPLLNLVEPHKENRTPYQLNNGNSSKCKFQFDNIRYVQWSHLNAEHWAQSVDIRRNERL